MNSLVVALLTVAVIAWWCVVPLESRAVRDDGELTSHKTNLYHRIAWWGESRTMIVVPWRHLRGGLKHPLASHDNPTTRYQAMIGDGNRRMLFADDDYYDDNDDGVQAARREHYPATDNAYDATAHHDGPPAAAAAAVSPLDRDPTRWYQTPRVWSPSNAFKSADERRLYYFWRFLINGNVQELLSSGYDDDNGDDDDDDNGYDDDDDDGDDEKPPSPQQLQQSSSKSNAFSQLFQYYCRPLIQKLTQRAEEQTPPPPPVAETSWRAEIVHDDDDDDVYRLWKSGLPLMKRSAAAVEAGDRPKPSDDDDDDDVRQLDVLKTADIDETGGKERGRAGTEESGVENVRRSIVENDPQGHFDKSDTVAYSKVSNVSREY